MNDETFNLEIRRFLKTFGVGAQREIERAVRDAVAAGKLAGTERLTARAVMEIEGLGRVTALEDTIALS